jgi:nitroreductase
MTDTGSDPGPDVGRIPRISCKQDGLLIDAMIVEVVTMSRTKGNSAARHSGLSSLALLDLLKSRRSIRVYKSDPVPEEMIEQILEAGRWAPSATNRQPWAFVVIRDEEIRRQVAEHAAYYFIRWAHVADAPVLIALLGSIQNRIYRQFLHEDIGLAGGQMMLQAYALGLGTCWIGGLDRRAIAGILKVPDDWEVVGLLTLGFPDHDPEPPPRRPLVDMVHYDIYGNQAEGAVQPGRLPYSLLGILLRRFRWPFGRRKSRDRF